MPAYNFKANFAPMVSGGHKNSTIRTRAATVGTTAHLFTGMRTKECELLGRREIISCKPISLGYKDNGSPRIKVGAKLLTDPGAHALALQDGFNDAREMVKWFQTTYKVPANNSGCAHDLFTGFLIEWEPL